ncbi:MAG TPA: hypothetical protein PKW82_04665 [Spirochaetales bacterium]|nr:hypothetical protein [Spirochaetales bacterium]
MTRSKSRRAAFGTALALAPLLAAAWLAPPPADAPLPPWAPSLAILAWLRLAAWLEGRDERGAALLMAAGLPFRAWAWSALSAADSGGLAFLVLSDLALLGLGILAPAALRLDPGRAPALVASLACLAAGAVVLARLGPAPALPVLALAAALPAWFLARRRR